MDHQKLRYRRKEGELGKPAVGGWEIQKIYPHKKNKKYRRKVKSKTMVGDRVGPQPDEQEKTHRGTRLRKLGVNGEKIWNLDSKKKDGMIESWLNKFGP